MHDQPPPGSSLLGRAPRRLGWWCSRLSGTPTFRVTTTRTGASTGDVRRWRLECLDDADAKPRWDAAQHAAAAYDLGAFSARWSSRPPSGQEFPWLSQRWLRGWLGYAGFFGAQYAAKNRSPVGVIHWSRQRLPSSTYSRFVDLLDDADDLLSVLEHLPVTLAHHDAQWRNLFELSEADAARPGARTVALDWGFVGLAPVGADLGHLIACNIEHWVVDPSEASRHDKATTAAYLHGLKDFGWRGDERAVVFTRAATAALQIAPFCAAQVSWLHGEPVSAGIEQPVPWPQELATKQQLTVDAVMAGWASIFTYLLELGDEARALASIIR